MKPVKKMQQDDSVHEKHISASDELEEEAVLSLTMIGILVARSVNILGQ